MTHNVGLCSSALHIQKREGLCHYRAFCRVISIERRELATKWRIQLRQAAVCLNRIKTRAHWTKIDICAHSRDREPLQVDSQGLGTP